MSNVRSAGFSYAEKKKNRDLFTRFFRDKEFNGMWFEGVLVAIHDETTFEVSPRLR